MPINPKKILFISKHAVHQKMAMAGNQFFYQTLLSFCQDERFDVAWMTVQKEGEDYRLMRSEFAGKSKDYSKRLPNWLTLFTHIFYHTRLRQLLSFIRADWYLLDPINRFYFKSAINRAFAEGYRPDIIVLEWTEVLFLEDYCREKFPNAKLVVTEHDVTFVKLQRLYKDNPTVLRKLIKPLQAKELSALNNMDLIRVLSRDDETILKKCGITSGKIRVVTPFFQRKNRQSSNDIKPQIIFYGALNRSENIEAVQWFIEKVFVPFDLGKRLEFVVIGGGNKSLKEHYIGYKGVVFTGFVSSPDDIFVNSLCMVVPLLNGGGIKIKVLEAMTCSLPVLTNEIGIEGIGARDRSEFFYCNQPKQYKEVIASLLTDLELRRTVGENAKNWIEDHFDYEKDLHNYKKELLVSDNELHPL